MTEQQPRSMVAVLRHRGDPYGERSADNVIAALRQVGTSVQPLEIAEALPDLTGFIAVLLCTERIDRAHPGTATALRHFVQEGGGLVILHRGLSEDFRTLFGILPQDSLAAPAGGVQAAGLHFPSRVLPSVQGLRLDETVIDGHAAFDVVPQASARIVATTWTGRPLAWRTELGRGYVLYWNSTICSEKRMRGLIVESLESAVPVSVVPMANLGVVQIDDFPAPHPPPPAALGGSGDPDRFYSHVWWPDVHRLAQAYDIALTCFVAFDYSNVAQVGAPSGVVAAQSTAAVRRLPPAEIGLHGHNHLPLSLDYWPNRAAMAESLERAVSEWQRAGLGPLPTSYVPPMNIYDAEGVAALAKVLPGITSICSVVNGALGGATQRDFGPEPWNNDLFCLPRATWGHECTPQFLFDCASQVAALGVWTHFLHPDDLIDVPGPGRARDAVRNPHARPWRNRRGARGLHDELARMFAEIRARFPWLAFRSTSDAVARLKRFLDSAWRIEITDTTVVVAAPPGSFFRMRLNGVPRRCIAVCEGGSVLHEETADDYRLYVIELVADRAVIALETEKPPQGLVTRLSRRWRITAAG